MNANQQQRAITALKALRDFNPLCNGLDAYWLEVARWGLGERDTLPRPEDYGLPVYMAIDSDEPQ